MLINLHGHTIETDLLSNGWTIDAGCRNWKFALEMKKLGNKVYCLDIEDMEVPKEIDIFNKKALSDKNGHTTPILTQDRTASHVTHIANMNYFHNLIEMITLTDIKNELNSDIDVLKMDIEGSEYKILADSNFNPVAKQMSIEFHEHCFKELHDSMFNSCISNIEKYYNIIQMDRYPDNGSGMNYWDCLFSRKTV
jgi:FkbM family methyltransferase